MRCICDPSVLETARKDSGRPSRWPITVKTISPSGRYAARRQSSVQFVIWRFSEPSAFISQICHFAPAFFWAEKSIFAPLKSTCGSAAAKNSGVSSSGRLDSEARRTMRLPLGKRCGAFPSRIVSAWTKIRSDLGDTLAVLCGCAASAVDPKSKLAGNRQSTIAIVLGRQAKNFPWRTPRTTETPRIWILPDRFQK